MISNQQNVFERIDIFARDPFEFISKCIYSRDEVDQYAPIKKSPSHLSYIRHFCHLFTTERLILVPKSRRMWVTWLVLACFLWDTMFHRVRANFIVSKKEDDANALLDRVTFMIDNIPEEEFPKKIRPAYRRRFCMLDFDDIGSYIKAVPQGEDQLRQYTASGIFMDEFAFMNEDEKTYGASIPTIQGGGRCVIVSTPPNDPPVAGSFFEKIVFDKMNS